MYRDALFLLVAAHCCLSAASAAGKSPAAVVVVSRHGIRPPFGPDDKPLTADTFKQYSTKPFPVTAAEWNAESISSHPVTEHGKLAIKRMGDYFRHQYSKLFSDDDCSRLFFYADDSLRDVQTATEFIAGVSPSCAAKGLADNITKADAAVLFNQGALQTEMCGMPDRAVMDSLLGGSEGGYAAYNRAHSSFIADVQDVVDCCPDPTLCRNPSGAEDVKEKCTISGIPSHFTGLFYAAINGSAALAGYFASFFMLAALNNMTLGLSGERTLEDIIHWYHSSNSQLDVLDSSFSAPSFASTLASHVVASLQQAATGRKIEGLVHGPGSKFVYMAGHDINLILLRTLLGLTWLADGWHINDPGPGGMIVFELYEDEGGVRGSHSVEISFQIAQPHQIRNASKLTSASPPSRSPVILPGCGGLRRCPLAKFTSIVLAAVKPACVGIPALRTFVGYNQGPQAAASVPAWDLVSAAMGSIAATTAVVAPLSVYFQRKKPDASLSYSLVQDSG